MAPPNRGTRTSDYDRWSCDLRRRPPARRFSPSPPTTGPGLVRIRRKTRRNGWSTLFSSVRGSAGGIRRTRSDSDRPRRECGGWPPARAADRPHSRAGRSWPARRARPRVAGAGLPPVVFPPRLPAPVAHLGSPGGGPVGPRTSRRGTESNRTPGLLNSGNAPTAREGGRAPSEASRVPDGASSSARARPVMTGGARRGRSRGCPASGPLGHRHGRGHADAAAPWEASRGPRFGRGTGPGRVGAAEPGSVPAPQSSGPDLGSHTRIDTGPRLPHWW
ncbi:hypothetical protein G443_000785 [Actinoalloteichus cyanogriseus DSM 43889]|uniref:Uncharacterized protein n=1 Tax=Actinoalloteichus caeruleus DSM 43889 TaxID=1120930 RepID=A0ABT1JDE4_ACTCY|nr:hypothetical protein [Actinoalloteichus caeruleus DSM 43889]